MKIIITARIEVDPTKREKALADVGPIIEETLKEPGCIYYYWAADCLKDGLIIVYEEWESEEALDMHFGADNFVKMHQALAECGLVSASATKFSIDREGPVFNSDGVATSKFD